MRRTTDELEAAEAEEPEAFALRRYMRRAVDGGVGSIMALIADDTTGDREVMALRDENRAQQRRLLERAKREGSLRDDVDFADLGLAITRFSRPIGSIFDPELESRFAHRQLDVFIDWLRAECATTPLGEPALSLEQLRAMRPRGILHAASKEVRHEGHR